MRNCIVIKEKTWEEVARCGSAKSAARFAKQQKEKYIVMQRGKDGIKQIL